MSSYFARLVSGSQHRSRERICCPVSGCTSYTCHRNLDDGEQLYFPYCSHHICTALKGESACFHLTEYDEPYCHYHENMMNSRSVALFQPVSDIPRARGYPYTTVPSTQRVQVQTYHIQPVQVGEKPQFQAMPHQEIPIATTSDKPAVAKPDAPKKKVKLCAHKDCKEKTRPGRTRCVKHTCNAPDCSAAAVETPGSDFPYCMSHTCVIAECIAPKNAKAQACRVHRCKVKDCLSVLLKGSFCKDHGCSDQACVDQRATDADRCPKHKCQLPDCNVAAQVEGGYCAAAHGCAESSCANMRAANCEEPLLCAHHNGMYQYIRGAEEAGKKAEAKFEKMLASLMISNPLDGDKSNDPVDPVIPKSEGRRVMMANMRNQPHGDFRIHDRMPASPLREQHLDLPQTNAQSSRNAHRAAPQHSPQNQRLSVPQTSVHHPAIPKQNYPTGFSQRMSSNGMSTAQQAAAPRQADPLDELLVPEPTMDVAGRDALLSMQSKHHSAHRSANVEDYPLHSPKTSRRTSATPMQNHAQEMPRQATGSRRMNPSYASMPLDALQPESRPLTNNRQQVHFAHIPNRTAAPSNQPVTSFGMIAAAVQKGFDHLLRRQKSENQTFWDTHEPWDLGDEYEELRDRQQVQRDAFMKVADDRIAAVERMVPYGPRVQTPEGYERVKMTRRYPLGSPRTETIACREAYLSELYL